MTKKIAIIIPCLNEEKSIEKVIQGFQKELPHSDIYVYDNNSTDNTKEIALKNNVIVRDELRRGKGNVIRSALREIDADIYIMVDGDNTYLANDVHKMLDEIKNGYDIVTGDRLSNGSYSVQKNKRGFHEFGNKLTRKMINFIFSSNIKDIMTGYRVFTKDFAVCFPSLSDEFEIETEMTIFALDRKFKIKEMPIQYIDREEGSHSKLNTFRDGFKVIKTIFMLFKNNRPLKFFTTISALLFVLSLLIGAPVVYEFVLTHYVSKVPSAILAASIMLISMISFSIGILLDTQKKYFKENFEMKLKKIKLHKK